MREDFLHFIWKYGKLRQTDVTTTDGEKIQVVDVGSHNHLAGPDFFNAKVRIDDQLWAGNVEIHLKSSDWYAHHHERDAQYNNVILHVVWQDDGRVFRSDNSQIPTLQLKDYVPDQVLARYRTLFDSSQNVFINCENEIGQLDSFLLSNWMDRLYVERLEQKSAFILDLLDRAKNDWEQVLFTMLLKNFGLNINADPFLSLAEALHFSVVRKLSSDLVQLESVLFGMSHLLEDEGILDAYYVRLKKEFEYQRHKFKLDSEGVRKPGFFKLRPSNFPTIRLSQFANLYTVHQGLFHKVIAAGSLEELYQIFEVAASDYWNDHFTFGKVSGKSTKKLTKSFVDLLLINTVVPLKFCYAQQLGQEGHAAIERIIKALKKEENSIVSNFEEHGVVARSACDSQATLQLYKEYCSKNRCLHCAVGNRLMGQL